MEIKGVASVSSKPYLNQPKKFKQITGLNYDEAEGPQKVVLAVTPTPYKYLESLPLHKTQQKAGLQKDGRILVHLQLIPNYELKMQLLKLGDKIEVLKPDYLRQEIKETLQNPQTLQTVKTLGISPPCSMTIRSYFIRTSKTKSFTSNKLNAFSINGLRI